MKLVDLETAKILQELGFGYDLREVTYTHGYFKGYGDKSIRLYREETDQFIPAPRLDDVAYWLRDNYKLNIVISIAEGDFNYFHLTIEDFSDTKYDGDFVGSYSDPTDALEVGVKRCLEIVKQRIN